MITPDLPPFVDDALCAQTDPELFFPDKGSHTGQIAKGICMQCPVRTVCLEWALVRGEDGIWGGTSPKERQQLRAEHGIELRPLQPCGTRAAWQRHRQAGEEPCQDCVDAKNEYHRRYELRRGAAA